MSNPPTLADLIRSATREAAMRRAVYKGSQMDPSHKAHELRCIDSIVRILGLIAQDQDTQTRLLAAGAGWTDDRGLFEDPPANADRKDP
jgi:hypothetical protein